MDDAGGALRRSWRRINPFRASIFRLPATPRLVRRNVSGGGGESNTDWNFARTSSAREYRSSGEKSVQCDSPVRIRRNGGDAASRCLSDDRSSTMSLLTAPFDTNAFATLQLPIRPLFRLENVPITFFSSDDLHEPFVGRDWVFREVYESAVRDKLDVTCLAGCAGSGKTDVVKQIVLHSQFYHFRIVGTCHQNSATLTMGPRNEWLRAVATRVVAWHICDLQNVSSCSIPEFVCNLAAWLAVSQVLQAYARILSQNPELLKMLRVEECERLDCVEVFRKAIAQPLSWIESRDQGPLLIVVDGLDHAEFYRSEDDNCIGKFLRDVRPLLPKWLKVVVASESFEGFGDVQHRTICIDDTRDERIVADQRLLLRSINGSDRYFEKTVENSRGSMIFVALGKFLDDSSLIPESIDLLLERLMDQIFKDCNVLLATNVLNVLATSMKPLTFDDLREILYFAEMPRRSVEIDELRRTLDDLKSIARTTASDHVVLRQTSVRNFLLHVASPRFRLQAKFGHMLHATRLASRRELSPSEMFVVAHHVLKANPAKHLRRQPLFQFAKTKDSLLSWLRCASDDISTALCSHRHLRYPNLKATALLIEAGADVDVELGGVSLIEVCAEYRFFPLVKLLVAHSKLQHIASLIAPTASKFGDLETVRHTVDALDADCLIECCVQAASAGHLQVLTFLLNSKRLTAENKKICIERCADEASSKDHVNVLEFALQTQQIDTARCMQIACRNSALNVVPALIARGEELSTDWNPNDSPLHSAVHSGSWQMLMAALKLAADVDSQDDHGRSPLSLAAARGDSVMVDILLARKAKTESVDDQGWTPLVHAVCNSQLPVVRALLRHGADGNIRDVKGRWIAHLMCQRASNDIIEALLGAGIDIDVKDKQLLRPIEVAIASSNKFAVRLLVSRGARLRGVTWDKAVQYDFDVVFILLNKLLEDANLLTKKKKYTDALHRLNYAVDRITRLHEHQDHSRDLLRLKQHALLATARILRKQARYTDAVQACVMAESVCDDDDEATFAVALLRAKCHFDARQLQQARECARIASLLRPFDDECRQLLAILQSPLTHVYRF